MEEAQNFLSRDVSAEAIAEVERLEDEPPAIDVGDVVDWMVSSAQGALSEGYSSGEAAAIAGISYRQLDYWIRTELIQPSIERGVGSGKARQFSFADLMHLRLIKRLLDQGHSLQSVRRVMQTRELLEGEEPGEEA
jgi:hypothetical protein